MAVRDGGNAEWTVVNGGNGSIPFSPTQPLCPIAYVAEPGTGSNPTIQYDPRIAFSSHTVCPASGRNNRSASFTLNDTGLIVSVGYGDSFMAVAFPGVPGVLERILPGGDHDIVVYLPSDLLQLGADDRMFIQRYLDLPHEGSTTFDMQGSSSIVAQTATLTVTGLQCHQVSAIRSYLTGSDCSATGTVLFTRPCGTAQTDAGVSSTLQCTTDKYLLVIGAATMDISTRVAVGTRDFGPRTEALPSVTCSPAIIVLPGDGRWLQATYAVPVYVAPSEYVTIQFLYNADNKDLSMAVLDSYLQAPKAPLSVEVPDFPTMAGWQANWPPPMGTSVEWTLLAVAYHGGAQGPGSLCDDLRRGVRSERRLPLDNPIKH